VAIEKADGSRLTATQVRFNTDYEKLTYKTDGRKKKLKYNEIRTVTSDKFTFRYFKEGKKHHGYFVKTESADKILAFIVYTPSAGSATGFASVPKTRLAIFDKQGKLIEEFAIRQGKSLKDVSQRKQVTEKILREFKDCPKFFMELSTYLTAKEDENYWQIAKYFHENGQFIVCK
jgi:hypothetical protein